MSLSLRLKIENFKLKIQRKARGFTLIEVIVSASLMADAMTTIAVTFLSSFVGQRKVISFEQTNSNARIIMDQLSREIRASRICGNTGSVRDCKDPANNTPINDVSFRLDIVRNVDRVPISYCIFEYPPGAGIFAAMGRRINNDGFLLDPCDPTDPNVQILNSPEVAVIATTTPFGFRQKSGFITRGVGQNPNLLTPGDPCENSGTPEIDICQPRTTILLFIQSLTHKDDREKVEVQTQTTISQRFVDIP